MILLTSNFKQFITCTEDVMTTENISSSPIIPITDLPPPISDPVVVPAIIYPTVVIDGEYQVTTYENGTIVREFIGLTAE